MSKVTINNREYSRAWLASGSQGVSLQKGIFPYDLLPPWSLFNEVLWSDQVMPTGKSLSIDPIEGNTALRPNGETPKRIKPRSMALEPWTMTTVNSWGHSNLGLTHHDQVGTFGPISRDWVISIITDQPDWEGKEKELNRICDLLEDPVTPFTVRPVVEFVGGCPNADIPLENILRDNEASVALLRKRLSRSKWTIGNNITPIASVEMCQRAEDAGADYLRLCNAIPHGNEMLPLNIPWALSSPVAKWCKGKRGAYSGPFCTHIIFALLKAARPKIKIPIGVGNGIYSEKLVLRAYEELADFISFGMVKLYRPWRIPGLVRAANGYEQLLPLVA